DYYFKQALKGDFRHSDIKQLTPYSNDKVFFNGKIVDRNKNYVVLIYTENLDKKSKAYMALLRYENEIKLVWEKSLNEFQGLENLIRDDTYFQVNSNENELVIWYWGSQKRAIGIDLIKNKSLWNISI